MKQKFYHVYSKGVKVLFRDENDYIFFINRLAIAKVRTRVSILAYTVMSTHFHLVLQCANPEAVEQFKKIARREYKIYFTQKYCRKVSSPDFRIAHKEVTNYESLKNTLIYVLKNPVHHQIDQVPFHYEYSSCKDIFEDEFLPQSSTVSKTYVPVGDLTVRKRKDLFGRNYVPEDFIIETHSGRILSKSFVNLSFSRAIWENKVKSFLVDMNRNTTDASGEIISEDKLTLHTFNLNDSQVCAIIDDFALSKQLSSPLMLTPQDKTNLIQLLRRKYVPQDQIARCLWLEE